MGVDVMDVPARRIGGRALTVLFLRLAASVAGVAVAGLLSRRLGPSGFGELSLIFSVAILASSLGELGTTQVVVGEMAARPERRRELTAAFAVLRTGAGVVTAAGGCVVLTVLLDRATAEWAGMAVLASVPLAGISSLVVLASARLRPDVGAALALGQSALWLVAVVVLGARRAPLAAYGLAFLACVVAQAGLTWILVVRREPPAWARWRPALGWLVRRGWPLAVTGVLVAVYYRLDGVLVFHLTGPEEAGFYAGAYRFLDALQLAPAAVAGVLLPLLAQGWARGDRARVAEVTRLGVTVSAAVAVPVGVGGLVVGDRVAAAVFGPGFGRTGQVLAVLGLAFFSIATGYVYFGVLVATGRIRVVAAVSAVAAVSSVAADLVVIPRSGAMGAAWVTVAVEYFVSSSLAVWISRQYGFHFPWDRLRAAGVAAAAMGAVAWSLRDAPLFLLLAASVASYALAAVALGVLSRDELRALADRRLPLGTRAGERP